jgi:hypothetical protein
MTQVAMCGRLRALLVWEVMVPPSYAKDVAALTQLVDLAARGKGIKKWNAAGSSVTVEAVSDDILRLNWPRRISSKFFWREC